MTHRLFSLLAILTSIFGLLALETNKLPPSWHVPITVGAVVLLAVSQSVRAVVKGSE